MKSCIQNLNYGDTIYISMSNTAFRSIDSQLPETHIAIWYVIGFGIFVPYASRENHRGGYSYAITKGWDNCIVRIKKCQQHPIQSRK
jgi:hypothetical protein